MLPLQSRSKLTGERTMPSGVSTGAILSLRAASATLGIQCSRPIFSPLCWISRVELLGALMMRCQTFATGTGGPGLLRLAISARQSSTFIRMKNAAMTRKKNRDHMDGSGRGDLNCLAGFQAFGFEAGVRGQNAFEAHTIGARDGRESFV